MSTASGYLRIGELSRRTGVSPELLRAWERRYRLLQPDRSAGGFRLYSDADAERIAAMTANIARGLSAAEAARLALSGSVVDAPVTSDIPSGAAPEATATGLREAVEAFDEVGANNHLDRLLASYSLDTVLRDAVVPVLRQLGDRYGSGEVSIAQEHFASNLLQGRLMGLARGWGQGHGSAAVLACPPGEQHELGLICFGLALRARGWRIIYLGADTPIRTIEESITATTPSLVVVAAEMREHLEPVAAELASLARAAPVALAGHGATGELAARVGAVLLEEDPVSEAERVSARA